MPRVVVEPTQIELEVVDGETIYAAALRLGYKWPTICGGLGTCSTCWVSVNVAPENLSEMSAYEREGLMRLGALEGRGSVRLACQAKPLGDVTVTKRGVRRMDSAKASKEEAWVQR